MLHIFLLSAMSQSRCPRNGKRLLRPANLLSFSPFPPLLNFHSCSIVQNDSNIGIIQVFFFLLLSNIFGNFVVLWYTTSRHSLSIDILVLTLLTSYILSNPRAIRANLSLFQPFHKSHFFPSKIFSLTSCMDVGSIRPKNINIFHPIYMWFLKFFFSISISYKPTIINYMLLQYIN